MKVMAWYFVGETRKILLHSFTSFLVTLHVFLKVSLQSCWCTLVIAYDSCNVLLLTLASVLWINQKDATCFASLQLRDSGMLIPRQVFVFCRGSAHVKVGYWHVWGYWAPFNGCQALQGTFEVVQQGLLEICDALKTLELRWILWEIFRLISMLPSDLCHVLLTSFYVPCCCPWQRVTCLVSGHCRHLWEGGECWEGNGVLWQGCWALFWGRYWQHGKPMQDKGCPVCCAAWTVRIYSLP